MAVDREVRLALRVASDAQDAAKDIENTADAYADLGKEVDKAGRLARLAEGDLSGVTDSADTLASKSAAATGALGALSSGFDLVGLEQYSGALGAAGQATDFLSGVGDAATLILENQKVAQIASTVASKGAAAATKAQTIAQNALNIAQRLNPIGLIILAVIALIAGLILLYKKSETFRNIIQSVGKIGKEAIGWIVDIAGDLVGWIKDKVPAAFSIAKDLVVRYITLVTTPWRKLFEIGQDIASFVKDKIPEAFTAAKNVVTGVLDAILSPFEAIQGAIQKVIELIGSIDLGVIGDIGGAIGGLLRGSPGKSAWVTAGATTTTTQAATPVVVNITVNGALDSYNVAQQIVTLLQRYARIGLGDITVLTGSVG